MTNAKRQPTTNNPTDAAIEKASDAHSYPGEGSTTGSDHPQKDREQQRGEGRPGAARPAPEVATGPGDGDGRVDPKAR